jgi:phosphopantetheinyl transferase
MPAARAEPAEPAVRRTIERLSVEAYPELLDHVFYPQPPGWPTLSDLRPVVPMTMSFDLMIEHASRRAPGRVAIGLEDVRMFTWLVVDGPTEITIVTQPRGDERVHVRIEGFSEGTVVFGERYPAPPRPDLAPLDGACSGAGEAERIYPEGWMFHGPAYQGITRVDAIGRDAVRGELTVPSGRGAALDNAGQLFGMWGVRRLETDQMTLPSGVKRLAFFGPPPAIGERLACTARIRNVDEKTVSADISIERDGRVWVTAEGWDLRRFDTDAKFWAIIRRGQLNLLADIRPEGFSFFEDRYVAAFTRDQLLRRFLGEAEREALAALPPRAQRPRLAGRVAAKDALRDLLLRAGSEPLFPAEIVIDNDASGRPLVRSGTGRDLRVSIAHKDRVAVALAAEGRDVGIDVERIEPRDDAFVALAFRPEELDLIADLDRAEGLTRLWTAKEAAAKRRGTGLGGNPRAFRVRERAGDRFAVDDCWVATTREGEYVIGWTL